MVDAQLHRKLFQEANGDYALIADRLRMECGDRLVLDDGPRNPGGRRWLRPKRSHWRRESSITMLIYGN